MHINIRKIIIVFSILSIALVIMPTNSVSAIGEGEILDINSLGGSSNDCFFSVTAVSDGFVAVGHSHSLKADMDDIRIKGAIIVKYNDACEVVWKKSYFDDIRKNSYGYIGSNYDSVTAVSDGVVVVGFAIDMTGEVLYKAIIVKYDNDGSVVWTKQYGESRENRFISVTTVSDGVVAIYSSFIGDNPYQTDFQRYPGNIIVKYNNDGEVVWEKILEESIFSITAVSDGIIVGGQVTRNGRADAVIVKMNNAGQVVWKRISDWELGDSYNSVTTVSDGIVAVGTSQVVSRINNNSHYHDDAIIVKYNSAGQLVWKKWFGGLDDDEFLSVTTVPDGVVVIGFSSATWSGYDENENVGTFIMKYNNAGQVAWKKYLDNTRYSISYKSVACVSDGVIAAGFGWTTDSYNILQAASVVKHSIFAFVPVSKIDIKTNTATAGTPLVLKGTVFPSGATNKLITWSIKDPGTTGATIDSDVLLTTGAGTAVIVATISDGTAAGTSYTEEYTISVSDPKKSIIDVVNEIFIWVIIAVVITIILIALVIFSYIKKTNMTLQ